MSPTTFRDSSTRTTTADVSTPLWAILARNSSSTATPGPRSNPRPDYCLAQGAHSIRGSFFHAGSHWRRIDLKRVIAERFGVEFHPRYVGKLLQKLGFSHISARPRHPAQDERIAEAFKKTSRTR